MNTILEKKGKLGRKVLFSVQSIKGRFFACLLVCLLACSGCVVSRNCLQFVFVLLFCLLVVTFVVAV